MHPQRSRISIHALREEGDAAAVPAVAYSSISIHALREEGDTSSAGKSPKTPNFYPRPPRGGRHPYYFAENEADTISIHALREEGDSKDRDKISIFL